MNSSEIQPIPNEPVLFIKKERIMVVADLHIGIERELREKGLQVSSQTTKMATHLIQLIKKYNPRTIVILGDLKHNIPTSTPQERNDVQIFLEKLCSYCSINIIPGNHDGNIQRLLPAEVSLSPSDGDVIETIGFVHGHRWPNKEVMQCEYIVVGHTHPTIMLKDRLGYKTYDSCWLRGRCKPSIIKRYPTLHEPRIIIMPAFNPICGGIAVNAEPIIGPFEKIFDINNAFVYLLDGSALGKVKDI